MGRTLGAVCKRCRREGVKLFLKGARCENASVCAMEKRPTAPGMHGLKRGKLTDYGIHLREKQKVKTFYGVLEKQFRKYYQMAERSKGNTGKVLMTLLERRLDNIVYRLGFATSRNQARQIIAHGHLLLNGKFLDIPSYLVRPGDVISVKNKKGSLELVQLALDAKVSERPEFLEFAVNESAGAKIPTGTVLREPAADDVSIKVEPQLIVELCSR
ncbi:MAG: 30S ribosomal protein S4 [Planctomycetia bacterium]|nr:30S ribosomal protein S4 [Planctomycetia bacterium]